MGAVPNRAARRRRIPRDLTVVAVPFYFATMAVEYLWLRRRAAAQGPSAGDYERRDTLASLAMGVGSLIGAAGRAPAAEARSPRGGAATAGAGGRRPRGGRGHDGRRRRRPPGRSASAAPATAVAGPTPSPRGRARRRWVGRGVARRVAVGGWGGRRRRRGRGRHHDLGVGAPRPSGCGAGGSSPIVGTGALAVALAVGGWDFIYYWNHRFMHESRYMWADPRGAPLERALQPVDRAAPARGRRLRDLRALRGAVPVRASRPSWSRRPGA